MRHEYCEKNGIIITYSDQDVAFEDRETAMSILISNDGTILHSNFKDDPVKTQYFLDKWGMLSDAGLFLCSGGTSFRECDKDLASQK